MGRDTRARTAAVVVAIGIVLWWPLVASAQDNTTPIEPPADSLTIVTTELAPFVLADGQDADGFYTEIWQEVAAELGVSYDVVWVDSFGGLLPALDDGTADIAIAPLAPTAEREASYDFTSSVISSGPQLGYHERIRSRRGLISALVSRTVLTVLGLAIVGLIVLAHLMWLVERRHPEEYVDFDPSYRHGIWDGFWWAAVTVTTVGYGDKAPKSVGGKLVALLAMLISLLLVGVFVSQMTTVLGEQIGPPITSLDDLGSRSVGVVDGSTFANFIEGEGVSIVPFDSQQEVFEGAAAGTIDVIVANPFALESLGPDYGISPTGTVLYEEFETFGLADGSPWREPINQVLAELQASGEVEAIIERWRP